MSSPSVERCAAGRRIANAHFCLCLVAFAAYACAQEECPPRATDCYTVDERRIELRPSTTKETITFLPSATDEDMRAARATIDSSRLGMVREHPYLADFRVAIVELAPGVPPERLAPLLAAINAREPKAALGGQPQGTPIFVSGRSNSVLLNDIVVQFMDGVEEGQALALLRREGGEVVEELDANGLYRVRFPGRTAREALGISNFLHQQEIVEYSEPNFLILMPETARGGGLAGSAACPPGVAASSAADPLYDQQWYLNNTGATGTKYADVNAENAWEITDGSASTIVIAIIDSGVQTDHEDLQGHIVMPQDFTDLSTTEPQPRRWDGHGTAVAGIAAAVAGNSKGIRGMGRIKIMPIRIMYRDYEHATDWSMTPLWIRAALVAAADRAEILNNSWSRNSFAGSSVVNAGIDYALAKNRVLVFAAGNGGSTVGIEYPANLADTPGPNGPRTLIVVGATDQSDYKAADLPDWESATGSQLSVVAPGMHMLTTDIMGPGGYCPTDNYAYFSGTSAAAPLVAATAALILSQEPGLSPADVRARLETTAKDLGTTGFDDSYGHGRIDACRALNGVLVCWRYAILDWGWLRVRRLFPWWGREPPPPPRPLPPLQSPVN